MRSGEIVVLGFIIAALIAACSRGITPAESVTDRLNITVEGATIRYDTMTNVAHATFPVKIQNHTGDTVYFARVCGTLVMREKAREWIHIQQMNCVLITQPAIRIPPGSTYLFTHQVTGVPGERDLIMWRPPLHGTYRLKLALGTRVQEFADDKLSAEFVPMIELAPH